jgi:hypothetical protein
MNTVHIKINPEGWLPFDQRTPQQQRDTNDWYASLPRFDECCFAIGDPPEKVILHDLEIKVTGALLPRIWQTTGSCVGAAGARAYTHAILGDVAHRGDAEEIKIPFPYATYGVGRQLAGMRGRGDGSYGGAQAKAVANFGMLPFDSTHAPSPTMSDGWAKWPSSVEYAWSHPSVWTGDKPAIEAEAAKYKMQTVVPIETPDQAVQLLAQGYGVTIASSFGTRPSVRGDVLIGPWNTSWAHQMSIGGYHKHPTHGLIFITDNQWGPSAHPSCPTLSQLGVRGSFWMLEKDFVSIIRSGEVFGHSNTMGFPARPLNWDNILSL